jgi:molecular chaperone HscB
MTSEAGTGTGGWHGFAIDGDLHSCWLCQRSVAAKALRCSSCGAVQPFHDLNHFALFGLEQRFDLDLEILDRNYASARRILDPERWAVKNPKAGALAYRYTEAMAEAYETLRNPVARARYLLTLMDAEARAGGEQGSSLPEPDSGRDGTLRPDFDALAHAVAVATDCPTVDRLGAQAVRDMETCIHSLSTAFRAGRVGEARLVLAHLDRLESLSAAARRRRLDLCPPPLPPDSRDP